MTDVNGLPPGFGENDPDFMREAYAEAKKEKGDTSRTDVLFLKSGVTHCRVLPPHVNAPSWFREYMEHGLRPEGKFRTFTCPKAETGKCPICEKGKALYEQRTEESIEEAKLFNAKKAFLYNVYVYSNPDDKSLKNGIFVLKSGVKVYKQLMDFDNDQAGDWGNISSLTNGIDFRIERKGSGRFGTEYVCMPSPKRTNILERLAADGLEIGRPTDLFSVYPAVSYDELATALAKHTPEDE